MNWNKAKCFHPRIATIILVGTCMLASSWPAAGGAARAAPLSPGTIVVGVSGPFVGADNDSLIAVDPTTGATTTISDNTVGTGPSFLFQPASLITYITQQSDGSLLVVDDSKNVEGGGTGPYESRVYRVDPSTGNRTLIVDTSGTTPDNGITAARQVGSTVFLTTLAGLETVDPTTGAISPFSINGTNVIPPLYGFVNVGTDIYAASKLDTIYKIDSLTGTSTVLSGASVGTGPLFSPVDLAIDSLGNLYADSVNGIYHIDSTTGNRTLISATPQVSGDPTMGSGPNLGALAIGVSATGAILVNNLGTGQLLSIDPTTGNRMVVSQLYTQLGGNFIGDGLAVIPSVPEPSTLMLAALGGLALLAWRRR